MSLGRNCNQVGAKANQNNADLERRNIPATTEDVEREEGGNILGSSKTRRARGLCFGHTAAGPGLAAKIRESINLETGEILQGVSLCNTPEFEEPGHLTRGLSTWKVDEHDDLVLGYHNGNRSDDHPTCTVGGTVPAIQVGSEWRVAKFALPYVKEGRIVSRVGNNQRHNGAVERYKKKKLI